MRYIVLGLRGRFLGPNLVFQDIDRDNAGHFTAEQIRSSKDYWRPLAVEVVEVSIGAGGRREYGVPIPFLEFSPIERRDSPRPALEPLEAEPKPVAGMLES